MPTEQEAHLEIRQLFELDDFGQSDGVDIHRNLQDRLK